MRLFLSDASVGFLRVRFHNFQELSKTKLYKISNLSNNS